ncbi:MAG: ATP:corrinoid adenosyltransferase [uncultured archaeon A07HR60]|nr:MAG: ATP:corrinoid adenosyltransferase [uncultured archaeon A07HR60]
MTVEMCRQPDDHARQIESNDRPQTRSKAVSQEVVTECQMSGESGQISNIAAGISILGSSGPPSVDDASICARHIELISMTNTDSDPGTAGPSDVDSAQRELGFGGSDRAVTDEVEPSAPDDFGLVSVWWGDGKGKSTAAMGMGLRAAGHGFRVHLLQVMAGDDSDDQPTRGEYSAIAAIPGFTFENGRHYDWESYRTDTNDAYTARARGALARVQELFATVDTVDLTEPLALDGDPDSGVHMLIIDELLYAANRGLIDTEAVVDLLAAKPEGLELVFTGGHQKPEYLTEQADLVSRVEKQKHPFDAGQEARAGTEH